MSNTLEIYSAKVCPFAQRTLICAKEKQLDFKLVEIDLRNKPDWYASISPYGKVPLLNHNGQHIYESAVINEYLDEIFPEPHLLSSDPAIKAHMRIWIAYASSDFVPLFYQLLRSQDKAQQDELRNKMLKTLRFIEENLFGKWSQNAAFMFGENISLVDIALYPFFERFVVNGHYRQTKIPNDCVQLLRWINTMQTRTSVKETRNEAAFYIDYYVVYADGRR